MIDHDRRTDISLALLEVAKLLTHDCESYLEVYAAWDRARQLMDGFMDNPDWLQEWINARSEDDGDSAAPAEEVTTTLVADRAE